MTPAPTHSPALPAWPTRIGRCLAVVALLAATGCATGPHPRDPFEPFNRDVSRFNEAVDDAVLRPVATAYQKVTPEPVRSGVRNFFTNLTEPWSLVNNLLQFKIQEAGETLVRFGFNTVFGVGGIYDPASQAQLMRHRQDFAQTLGFYGVDTGPYLVLPLLGPSTVRDTIALPVVWTVGDPVMRSVDNIPVRNSIYALRLVDTRAALLRAGAVLNQAALDPYAFQRDVFLQLRDNEQAPDMDEGDASDGAIPPEPDSP